jgi:hypothetical protein
MALPSAPDAATRERVLDVLAELVARAGAERFLRAPVEPGVSAFPDLWAPTRGGVEALVRRLAWHAELEREGVATIAIDDRRAGKPVTERMPATRIEAHHVREGVATFVLGFVGTDDVAGTAAHEVGVVFAALHRPGQADPYRSAELPEIEIDGEDLERGSIATVFLGLGVVAANGAFQEYSRAGRFNGAYEPLEYTVLRAGYVPMSVLAYALAVQAVVRGEGMPPGLAGPQRDEVSEWMTMLRGEAAALRERLGIARDARGEDRPSAEPFADVVVEDDEVEQRTAFRWRTNRGTLGLLGGAVCGLGFALLAGRAAAPLLVIGGATGGHVIGRRVRVPRCSACATVVGIGAGKCPCCGAALRGDIDQLSERLEAEERLLEGQGDGDDASESGSDTVS